MNFRKSWKKPHVRLSNNKVAADQSAVTRFPTRGIINSPSSNNNSNKLLTSLPDISSNSKHPTSSSISSSTR